MRMDAEVLYYAVWSREDTINAKLRPDDVIYYLVTKSVLTTADKRELDREGRDKGERKKIHLLVQKLLQISKTEDGQNTLSIFMEGLWEKKQDTLAKIIEAEYEKLSNGPSDEFFNKVKQRHLKIWSNVTGVPDDFSFNINDHKLIMRPDFAAKIQHKGSDMEKKPGSDPSLEVKYKLWNVNNLEDIFSNDPSARDNVRVLLIKGDCGSGKTTLLHKYVHKWAMSRLNTKISSDPQVRESAMTTYKLVLYLPLKFIIKNGKLMDMILNQTLQYFSPPQRYFLERYFSDPVNESRTLFILDGIEDVKIPPSSDIIKLIQGDIYPLSKVVLCGRPYPYAVTQLRFQPDAIVNIRGIIRESGSRFIAHMLSEQSDANVKHMQHVYLNSTLDSNLLQMPLHLVIACFLFYHHRADEKPMDEFELPINMTRLFNAYLLRLLKLYVKKCGRKEECFFIRNPLSQDAVIPSDLKHLIYITGRIGFLSITNEVFAYTEDDLQANLVKSEFMEVLGVCTPVITDQSNAFFFRHKIIAEYLAGIYLSMEGFRVPEFSKVFDVIQKETLQELLGGLQNTVRFACGVSTNFFVEILKIASRKCVLNGSPAKDCYLTPYDATLYFETLDISNAMMFAWYLEHTELRSKFNKVDMEPSVYEWAAALFVIDNLEYGTVCKLLGRFYDMHLTPLNTQVDGETLDLSETFRRLQIKYEVSQIEKTRKGQLKRSQNFHLHQTGLFITAAASMMTFHDMHRVVIKDDDSGAMSTFLTLEHLLEAFPNVQRVEMRNMVLHSRFHRILNDKDYASLLKHEMGMDQEASTHFLSVLELDNVNPSTSVIRDLRRLEHIETVNFNDCRIPETEFESLSSSLQGSSDLKSLGINDNPLASKAMKLFSILATKPEFDELSMARCSLNEGAAILDRAMKDGKMGKLKQLQTLDISYNNLNVHSFSVLSFFAGSQLRVLKLEGNPLGPIAVKLFHQLAERDNLRELYMNNCALDGAMQPLATEIMTDTINRMHNMEVLHVCSNWLSFGSDALLSYFSTSHMTVLHISDNPLGQAMVSMLYVLADTNTVKELHLDNCDLDECLEEMVEALQDEEEPLKPLNHLTEVSLINNGFTESSLPLIKYFTVNNKLRVFRLSKNDIGAELVAILNSLAKFNSIRELHLENCNLEAALKPLQEAMEESNIEKLNRLKLVDISLNFLEYITKGSPNRTLESYFSSNRNVTFVCK